MKKYLSYQMIFVLCLFISCEKSNLVNSDIALIKNVNMKEMARLHLSSFSLLRERSKGITGTEYVYHHDSMTVFITIGLHSSKKEAEKIAKDQFDLVSVVLNEGQIQDEMIGNKLWWWAINSDLTKVKNIYFIRNNALFIMSGSYDYVFSGDGKLNNLAKAIDDDILNQKSYIQF